MLTDRHLRTLRSSSQARDYHNTQQRGLIARILPSGIVQFGLRYRFQGTQRRLKLGEYPAVSLQLARKRARSAQASIDDGHDPAGERHAAKAERDERMLDADVLPAWRERSVRDLTRRDVRALVERVAERAPIMGNRVLALVRKMLNFAVDYDWIDANPAARVQKPAHETSRDRVLTDEELRRVWRVLSAHRATRWRSHADALGRLGSRIRVVDDSRGGHQER